MTDHKTICQISTEKDECTAHVPNASTAHALPRMRTINEAAKELKAIDPHTAMTPYHIRRLCLDGVIPTVKAGKKFLFDLDTLIEYMTDPTADKFKPHKCDADTIGGIRRIS